MGDVIYADFQTKSRSYTRGGGIDDLAIAESAPVELVHYHLDTAPCEYVAPERDPA